MTTIPQLSNKIKNLLTDVAERLGKQSGFVKRHSPITAAIFAQTLVFSWWEDPAASCEQRRDFAHLRSCFVSPQAIDQRFSQQSAEFMRLLLQEAIATAVQADPVNIPLLRRFKRVEVVDSSIVTLPDELVNLFRGCGTVSGAKPAALKLLFRLDLCSGRLSGPLFDHGRTNDHKMAAQLQPMEPGSLNISDLGFFSIQQFAAWDKQDVYWLSRYKHGTHLYSWTGERLDLLSWLRENCPARAEQRVQIGASAKLGCRLLAEKVPQHVVRQRRELLKEEARKESREINPLEWELARWTILLTNCAVEQMSVAEGLALAQARWQIELLIKRNKSLLLLDEWQSTRSWRVLTEVYAKLLIGVIQHWLLVVSSWANPRRSLWKSQKALGKWVRVLALALVRECWQRDVKLMLERLAVNQLQKRKKDPGLWQILLAATQPSATTSLS